MEIILLLIFFWLPIAIIVGVAANARGRSGFGWFLLAVLVSPLIAGLLLLLFPRANSAFRPDGMLGQTPFRNLPRGEVEALLQGAPVRFRNVAELQLMVDPNAGIVSSVPPAPKAFSSALAVGIAIVIAVLILAKLFGA